MGIRTDDKFQLSKTTLRWLFDGLGIVAAAASPVVAKFVFLPPPASIAPAASVAGQVSVVPVGISGWWLVLSATLACVGQIGSRWITYSFEKHRPPAFDWSVCGALHQFHYRAFGDKAGSRVTLFQADPADEQMLIPTHRYSAGKGPESAKEKKFSDARFGYGRAIVGLAWEHHCELIGRTVPDDETYDEWARRELQMSDEELGRVSETNRSKKYFAAWGFLDSHGRFLGAIAVDAVSPQPYGTIENPAEVFEQISSQLRFLLTG